MTVSRLPNNDGGVQPTILTAKGDLLTATAASTLTNLAVGSDGMTLVANSSAATGLQWQAVAPLANPVLNSAMQVWQRGTSISLAASTSTANGFTADRWQTYTSANQACTISRVATGDTTNLPNIQYAYRFQRNSGQTGTSTFQIAQSMESINSIPYAGKTVTLSFYARAGANYSAASSAFNALINTGTGTDQNSFAGYTGQSIPISGTATLTTTWQRFSYSGTIAATVTEIAPVFSWTPVGTAGANDYVDFTGVQIDVGSVALPFRTTGSSYQAELAACQRYYFLAASGFYFLGATSFYSATEADTAISFPVTMRIAPSLVASTGTGYYATNRVGGQTTYNSLTIYQPSQNAAMIYGAGSGTAGNSGNTYTANAAASVAFSAEL